MTTKLAIHHLTAAALCTVLMLASCGTSKQATTNADAGSGSSAFSASAYTEKVIGNEVPVQTLSAKMSFAINADGKQLNVGGNLKMKRNDVIQLSLVALGIMEAGRIEFTPDGVLLIDRLNRQYVRATYADLKFLKETGIDFYCLQALFWNELFVPGTGGKVEARRFKATPSGQSVVLQPDNTKKLAYRFITDMTTALIKQTNVSSQQASERAELNWRYNSFSDFKGRKFPDNMTLSVDGTSKNLRVDIGLSRLSDDSSWETRTSVSSKYKEVSAESILKKIMAL